MRGLLQLNNSDMSEEVQLELLAPWYTQRPSESRTLDLFAFRRHLRYAGNTMSRKSCPLRSKDQNARSGQERLVFAGAREELVERALRFIAVQQIAKTKLTQDVQTGRQAVTIFFSLSMLRRHLEQLGHGYKLSEIKEALDILADTRIAVEEQTIEAKTGRQRRTRDFASILTHYTASTVEGDTTGDEAYVAMTFHPAATAAILQLAFYPINQLRVGKLKRPLARWLTTRMSHNYRQAKKNGFVDKSGYHISLKTILDERGLPRETRLRANVESVRTALKEMRERRILAEMMGYDEQLIHAPSKRRPKIVDAIWTLYPSSEFVEEIVNGNKDMSIARTLAGGNKGESKLLPGFQEEGSRGK